MGATDSSIALTPEQIADLAKGLSHMRHDVNNHLSLIVAACELIKRKPELANRMVENIVQQPEKICADIRTFSDSIELILGIKRNSAPPVS
jgi:hypothetical protein